MKTHLAKSVVLMLALSGGVQAADLSEKAFKVKQDKAVGVGLGSGVIVGAIIGGPIGAVAAGMFGAVMGDSIIKNEALKKSHSALASTQLALSASQSALADTEQALIAADTSLAQLQKNQLVWQQIQSVIQFKTGSAALEPEYRAQLDALATVLHRQPELLLTLSGYADTRGDKNYNLGLSDLRATSVRTYLIDKGVKSEQLLTSAKGEAMQKDGHDNRESMFFDRKVVMTLHGEPAALTAAK